MGMDNLFILSANGEVLIEKHWRGKAPRRIVELFLEHRQLFESPREVPPVVSLEGQHYVFHVRRAGLLFISSCGREVQSAMVIELLHRIVDMLFQYAAGTLSEAFVRDNFDVVYHLLDEMVDAGFASTTEPNQLKDLVAPPSLQQQFLEAFTGKATVKATMHEGLARMPWRNANVKYVQNEIYFDQIEFLDCIVGTGGQVIVGNVMGELLCNCKLSGMPDVTLTFRQPSLLDDASLHRCVRIAKFREAKVVSFIPPDKKFRLMSYRVKNVTQLPIAVAPRVTPQQGSIKYEITVTPSRFLGERQLEAVVLVLPLPRDALQSQLTATLGTVKNDAIEKKIRWDIGRMLPGKRYVLSGSVQLPPHANPKACPKPTLSVEFQAKGFCASGLQIDRMTVHAVKYKPTQSKRILTQARRCDFRT